MDAPWGTPWNTFKLMIRATVATTGYPVACAVAELVSWDVASKNLWYKIHNPWHTSSSMQHVVGNPKAMRHTMGLPHGIHI